MLREESIKVVTINPPTKEESAIKIQELCKYLEEIWTEIPSNFNVPTIAKKQSENE